MISHIHHINFIVKNLDNAVNHYQKSLGFGDFTFDSLAQRGVKTARIKLGDTWLVLVQPTDTTSLPAQFLADNGEGFFLLSFGTDDLDKQLKNYVHNNANASIKSGRYGLDDWYVNDLPSDDFFGVQIQLTEEEILKKQTNIHKS